jgi:hypothetical protein
MSTVEKRKEASPGGPLGFGSQYLWQASADEVDVAMPASSPIRVSLSCRPQHITIDLRRAAVSVIDMQNDFSAEATIGFVIGSDAMVTSLVGLAAR